MQQPSIPTPTCWVCHEPLGRGVPACADCGALQPVRWEYRVEHVARQSFHIHIWSTPQCAMLDRLGRDGWELVAVTDGTNGVGGVLSHTLVFKRRLI